MLEYYQIVSERPLADQERSRFLEVMEETVHYFEASIETPFIGGRNTTDKAELGSVETKDEAEALVVALNNRIAKCSFSIVTRHDEAAERFVPRGLKLDAT